MKKSIYILSVLLAAVTGCEKFLEEEPTALISDATFYKTYDQAVMGVSTAYAQIRGDDGELVNQTDMPSDLRVASYYSWLWTSTTSPRSDWSGYYNLIAEANIAIEKVQENADEINASLAVSNASSDLKDSQIDVAKMLEGEARFIRAFAYFKLVRYYGDAPLILNSFVGGNIPKDLYRAPKDSVYMQIREDLAFALENCAAIDFVPSGRVTSAAAAGMLAKVDLNWASISLRDEKYWDKNLLASQPPDQSELRMQLYSEALDLCNQVINGEHGNYSLETYYPAVTNKRFSREHIFPVHSVRGEKTNINLNNTSFHGYGGVGCTHYAQFLWDLPTWEDHYNSPRKIYELGFALNDTLVAHEWSVSGDTTRRLWNVIMWRGNPDPPQPVFWTVYEPLARFCGPEYFIEPGLGPAPYSNYPEDQRIRLNDNNGTWTDQIWTITGRKLSDPEIWRVDNVPSYHKCGKYRIPYPYPPDFLPGDYDHTYPVLRLAEIYLLRSEAKFFLANQVLTDEVISDLDVIRERAQNQAPLKEMMMYMADARKVTRADHPRLFRDVLPAGMSGNEALKIILDERARELFNENDTRWFDLARFPQVILPNLHEMSVLEQPLKEGIASGSNYYTINYDMKQRFGVETNLYMLYLPIPESEIEFYPGLTQTHGYK